MTTDAVLVAALFALVWAAVLVPPVADARAARRAEFQSSIRPPGEDDGHDPWRGQRPPLTPMARRRHILGGLLVAMAATLFVGLLPTFRLVLVVHLFVVDSFLAYVGLLVHLRDREARRRRRGRAEPQAARDRVGAPEAVVGPSEPARSPAFGAVTVAAPRAIIADLADSA